MRALADRGTTKGETVEIDRFTGTTTSQSVLWGGLDEPQHADRRELAHLVQRSVQPVGRQRRARRVGHVRGGRDRRCRSRACSTPSAACTRGSSPASTRSDRRSASTGRRRRAACAATSRTARRSCRRSSSDTPGGPEVLRWYSGGSGSAVRTFSDLNENSHEYSGEVHADVRAGRFAHDASRSAACRATRRATRRASRTPSARATSTPEQLALPLEQIFDGRFTHAGLEQYFNVGPLSQGGSYTARDRLTRRLRHGGRPDRDGRSTWSAARATRATISRWTPPPRSARPSTR